MADERFLVFIDEWSNLAKVASTTVTSKTDISNIFKGCVTFVDDYDSRLEAENRAAEVNQTLSWAIGCTSEGNGYFIPVYAGNDLPQDLQHVEKFSHFVDAFRSTL